MTKCMHEGDLVIKRKVNKGDWKRKEDRQRKEFLTDVLGQAKSKSKVGLIEQELKLRA